MNKESILVGIIGLLVGVGIAWATATLAVNNNNTGMMRMMGMHADSSSSDGMMHDDDMSMSQMMGNLQGKTGDDFDKTFIAEMIVHHQGAIDMANLAKTNAKHDEIKKMADDIVTAQTKEINQMKMWQNDWGYITSAGSY
jgi:uncharacterized protein (DUF305 family)